MKKVLVVIFWLILAYGCAFASNFADGALHNAFIGLGLAFLVTAFAWGFRRNHDSLD